MKAYSQLLHSIDNKPCEKLGSFAVMILDARNNLYTMKEDCEKHLIREQRLDKSICGYRIIRSARFVDSDIDKSRVVYENVIQ